MTSSPVIHCVAQDIPVILGCVAHDKDARGFGMGKLILFKDIHIYFIYVIASRVWATICLIFKSTSATFPG